MEGHPHPAHALLAPTRASVRKLHLWVGLLTGPLLLVLGLSGAALVLGSELDDALAGGRPAVSGAGPPASLAALVGAVHARYPDAPFKSLRLPEAPDRPARVELLAGRDRLDVLVDPRTARVLRGRVRERSVLAAVHSLHAGLHAGRGGAVAVALLGLVLVAESVTGLWLCRPWVRPPRRAPGYGLHRLLGVVSLALTLVVALSGVLLAVAGALAAPRIDEARAPESPPRLASRLEDAVARARAALPDRRVSAITIVSDEAGTIRVEMLPASGATRGGAVTVEIGGGEIVAVRVAGSGGAWGLVRRLHYGDFAGWASRTLWLLTGLSVPVLAITGYVMSSRSRRASVDFAGGRQ